MMANTLSNYLKIENSSLVQFENVLIHEINIAATELIFRKSSLTFCAAMLNPTWTLIQA
jgi:hypothetical protein